MTNRAYHKRIARRAEKQHKIAALAALRRRRRQRLPVQVNSREWRRMQEMLPPTVMTYIEHEVPVRIVLPKTRRTRSGLRCGLAGREVFYAEGIALGPLRDGYKRSSPGFGGSLPLVEHADVNLDRGASLRRFRISKKEWSVRLLLGCKGARRRGAVVRIETRRESAWCEKACERACREAPAALHWYSTGQGDGVLANRKLILALCASRLCDLPVQADVIGDSTRFLRTGTFLARTIFADAGIRVSRNVDHDEVWLTKQMERTTVDDERMLRRTLERIVLDVLVASHTGDAPSPVQLSSRVLAIPGVRDTVFLGATCDFEMRSECGLDSVRSARLMQHSAWRAMSRLDGYWLHRPGWRARRGLETRLRRLLLEGYESQCVELFAARWPHAIFDARDDVVIKPSWDGSEAYEQNIRALSYARPDDHFVAVDLAMIHPGSFFDLDALMRRRRSAIHAILPVSYLYADLGRATLQHLPHLKRKAAAVADRIAI